MLFCLTITSNSFASSSTILNEGWKFQKGEIPDAAAASFDDSSWRELRLPHDWAIEGPFDASVDGGRGKLPWKGQGWYRQNFEMPADQNGQRVYFDFDGVMAFPKVYINGQLAGEWDYGYTPFRIDATPFIKWGAENVIAVHVDTRKWDSRWYPGAGIYRKVSLTITGPVHLVQWGVQVDGRPVKVGPSTAVTRTTIENHTQEDVDITIRHEITDPAGKIVAQEQQTMSVEAGQDGTGELDVKVTEPLLWDVDHPHLYTVTTSLLRQGDVIETRQTRFGFRTFKFTADDGFHLNGRRVQLYGVNLHHDLGPLGGAFNKRAAQRQLEIMQEMGVNALRTSHNPPAAEVLDLCDEMGIVVWDEVFDKYAWTAGRRDLQPPLAGFSQRHIKAMIKRDINHPSIVVWSTGNEVSGDDKDEGINPERVKMMADYVRELDLSRPVAQACHIPGLVDGKNFDALDLTGWNYQHRYDNYRKQYPDRPIIYTESASTFSTRGFYDPEQPLRYVDYSDTFQVSSYDLNAASWSDIPDAEFRLMEEDSFVAGEFVWTGFDYLGEPTPFSAQARSSYFGIVDLVGFPKDRYYLYRSHWRPNETTVHILPHWNWPNRVGQNVPVFVYTNGDSAELFLNGQSLGKRQKGQRPPRAPNIALDGQPSATVTKPDNVAANAIDGNIASVWNGEAGEYWQLDLGSVKTVGQISVDFLTKENNYSYVIDTSTDAKDWSMLARRAKRLMPQWDGPTQVIIPVSDIQARYLRIKITEAEDVQRGESAPVGMKEFEVFGEKVENEYYDVTYDYRLRWNEVSYEPGELKVVAYKDNKVIGEAKVETVGAAAKLELIADRSQVAANGEDLVFISVNALDAEGRQHPLADNQVFFTLSGPGEIAGVGNGNPLSLEPFNADRRNLFYGKAMLIVRPLNGKGGTISVKAVSTELQSAELTIETRPAATP